MGERLNVEIFNKGLCLANAYYHWSGYTTSALNLTKNIIDNIKRLKGYKDIQQAVFLLQKTGAGFESDEKAKAKAQNLFDLQDFVDRDAGIINISPEGIQNARKWEEYRVKIYLDEKRIDFDAIYKEHRLAWLESAGSKKIEDLPVKDWILSDIKFKSFDNIRAEMLQMIEKNQFKFILSEYPFYVNSFVE